MHIAYTFVQIPCQTIDLTLFVSNIFFKFKQFTIVQDQCAMKVGTDGVLLGAWANIEECKHVLDIGTGTGLIALMIAQRNSKAIVDAIDIDEQCVVQAKQNIESSPFAERVDVESISFQNFSQQDDKRYDLIVSNPPYSIKWVGDDNPLLINDPRFAPAGVLAPTVNIITASISRVNIFF